MKKISLFILLLLTILSFFLFHDKGNSLIKPYVENYLQHQIKQDVSLKLNHLKIDLHYLEAEVILNELTNVNIKGPYSLLRQTFDLNYQIRSEGFKNREISFEHKMDINGTLIGHYKDMQIKGEGETLKSHIDYALNLKDDAIQNIKVKMNKADIASLLQLTSQPAYAEGKVDVDINIPTFEEVKTKGDAQITLHTTKLNSKIFQEVLQLNIPVKTTLTANLNAKLNAERVEVNGNIKSNRAWLKLSDTTYNLKSKALKSNYKLLAPQLSKLSFLTQQKLRGQLQVDGNMNIEKNHLFIRGESKDLSGESHFDYNGEKLNVTLNNIEITKLLYLLNENPYAQGKLFAKINLDALKNLRGSYNLKTTDAKAINKMVKERFDLDIGEDLPFSLQSQGDIASELVNMEHALYSDIFQYRSDDMQYHLKTKSLQSTYKLDIPNLSNLNTITGKPLQGELKINGEMNYDKSLEITGLSKSLGGEVDFTLKEEKLNAKFNNVPAENFMQMLSYPQIFQGKLVGDLYYDLPTQKGTLTSKLDKARLLPSSLTEIIKQIRGLDLTKERYNESYFNAHLNKNIIKIDFKAQNKTLLLEIPQGEINKANNQINAKYNINFENKNISGEIKGDLSNPKATIDSAGFLQEKVLDVIKDSINENQLKNLGIGEKEQNAIKNLLGDLFK